MLQAIKRILGITQKSLKVKGNFATAVKWLNEGHMVSRHDSEWEGDRWLYKKPAVAGPLEVTTFVAGKPHLATGYCSVFGMINYKPTQRDLNARDWFICANAKDL